MILIVAALGEELRVALDLCADKNRMAIPGVRAWQGVYAGNTIAFLRSGIGPVRSEKALRLFLKAISPSRILVIGYGGALDPSYSIGDVIIGRQASLFRYDQTLQSTRLTGTWLLADAQEVHQHGSRAGLNLKQGEILTSAHIIGEPRQKLWLHHQFGASIVDMETASLAKAATEAAVPLSCARVVSDQVQDEFLAPFSYDPAATRVSRVAKILRSGSWGQRYREWKERAAIARRSLREFLIWYLGSQLGFVSSRP